MSVADIEAAANRIFEMAESIYRELKIPVIEREVNAICAPGGKLYSRIVNASVGVAMAWYGMYKPKVYERGWTLTDPANHVVTIKDVKSDGGTSWSASGNVANTSPHAGFADGFLMPNREFRPGGPVVIQSGRFAEDIHLNPSEMQALWDTAVSRAIGAS